MNFEIHHRPRRLRDHPVLNSMITETSLSTDDLVLPVFLTEEGESPEPISSMPEIFRWPIGLLVEKLDEWKTLGIKCFAVFPHISHSKKDPMGDEILNPSSLAYRAAREIKAKVEGIALIADLALDPYTTHGHDGILSSDGRVDNDKTVEVLAQASILAAEAGYDMVAPSDMMDGRILKIRKSLDEKGHAQTGIISYSAKFSSSYYGPFRDAIDSKTVLAVDKSGYQLNPANFREAERELELDYLEGADMLMVKPAEPYLDVIRNAKNTFNLPIAAYQVSGEYSRIWAAHLQGWLDLEKCAMESLLSIKRAGADIIFTYFAERASRLV
jgi:porphobilinogen synthase